MEYAVELGSRRHAELLLVNSSSSQALWSTLLAILLFSLAFELLGLLFFILILNRLDKHRPRPGRPRHLTRVNPHLHSLWWDQRPARKELRNLDRNLDWPISLEENAAVVLEELESSSSSSS